MSFQLPDLTYNHDALEPHIDSKTMQIHHSKHHAGYTSKLNAAIEGTELANKSIEEILTTLDMSNSAVRNNGGGYYNHCLFWEIMSPNSGGEPIGSLSDAIKKSFGSFDEFKSILSTKGGFISAHWDGTSETEQSIKKETKATIRCIPFSKNIKAGYCVYSGKPSPQRVLFAKAY